MSLPDDPLASLDHRPWPLPAGPWVLAMRWTDLLFAHWPVPAAALAPLLPPGLALDTFDGTAWLGLVPFRMEDTRLRGQPSALAFAFPELNVRTYVRARDATAGGEPRAGVWFFSLDAGSRLVVRAARAWFGLPYFDARMEVRREGPGESEAESSRRSTGTPAARGAHDDVLVSYRSERTHRGAPPAVLDAVYGPAGEPFRAAPGTLEHWLTERYALFARRPRGGLLAGDIHHAPWPLQRAHATFRRREMTALLGLDLPEASPMLHYVRRLDVVAWAPRRIDALAE